MRARSCVLVFAALLGPACSAPTPTPTPAPVAAPVAAPPEPPASVTVRVEAVGRGTVEVERDVTASLEHALAGVADVTQLRSVSTADAATVTLTVARGAASDDVRRAVHAQLVAARDRLPPDVSPTIEADLAPRAQAVHLVLGGDVDGARLRAAARQVEETLVRTPGVGRIDLCGGREAVLAISVDPTRLAARGLSIDAITRSVGATLRDDALPGQAANVRVAGPGLVDLAALVVAPGEPVVRLDDVANIAVDSTAPRCDARRVGGDAVVLGTVLGRRGVTTAELAAALRTAVAGSQASLPAGLRLELRTMARIALTTTSGATPAATVADAARAIAAAIAASPSPGPGDIFVQASTPIAAGAPVDLELLRDAPGDPGLAAIVARVPGLRVRALDGDPAGLARALVLGDEVATAARLAEELAAIARGLPVVVDAQVRHFVVPELVIELDHQRLATSRSIGRSTPAELRTILAVALGGLTVGHATQGDARVPVRVQLGGSPPADPAGAAALLGALQIVTPGGTRSLADLAVVRAGEQPHTITRVDGRRAVEVELRLTGAAGAPREALQRAVAADLRLPPGYHVRFE